MGLRTVDVTEGSTVCRCRQWEREANGQHGRLELGRKKVCFQMKSGFLSDK